MNEISDIKHSFYINLNSRPDRKQYIEKEIQKIGLKIERFKAIELPNGALGCSMSHLKLLETAKKNEWDHILIIEDDIQFLNPTLFVNNVNTFLSRNKTFDVLLLAGNNIPPYTTIDETCIKVSSCQTTTGYLVQKHYFDTLIQNYRDGIAKLLKYPEKHRYYAIDKYWLNLQKVDNWYLIVPLTVIQREDYSNIEKRATNYGNAMLDLDKEAYFRAQLKKQSMSKMNLLDLSS